MDTALRASRMGVRQTPDAPDADPADGDRPMSEIPMSGIGRGDAAGQATDRTTSEIPSSGVARRPRVIIADHDPRGCAILKPALGHIGAEIVELTNGTELEHALEGEIPYDLVIVSSRLRVRSGLEVLTRARARGDKTPFIVVTSIHQNLLQVQINDGGSAVLASRVVDADNLIVLAATLVRKAPR